MKIIVNFNSMIPIYEQIVDEVKKQIGSGQLATGEALPSVRNLANELKISALTVKKAYDALEQEGYTATVHGKGTYVLSGNQEKLIEQKRTEIENELAVLVGRARAAGIKDEELQEMLDLLMED
ncbi:MAG: GntR family transcriptional regulator [Erysipelotrichaceae bacterium]|nr:GntR family transcriptional regulator [Erysipelotrichaceae bacterium]MBQ4252769.1 GntR family transcriptional regulator [Erysipelotrichaceae bacterium]